jgi:hypothetical protein
VAEKHWNLVLIFMGVQVDHDGKVPNSWPGAILGWSVDPNGDIVRRETLFPVDVESVDVGEQPGLEQITRRDVLVPSGCRGTAVVLVVQAESPARQNRQTMKT